MAKTKKSFAELASRVLRDISGGITSAVVMLPLALAFGVASGLGPLAGIYGAIAVGFFAAVFGGTGAQISGPTGPMTITMAAIVTLYSDSLVMAFTIVMLAGVIQIVLGLSKIGSFLRYTSYSVVAGFLTGIGVIIIVLQINPILGAPMVSGGVLDQVGTWPSTLTNIGWQDLAVGTIALVICIFWPKFLRKFLPAPLLALVVGTLLAVYVFQDTKSIGQIPTGLPELHFPHLAWKSIGDVLGPALIVALVGSIDSLLTSLVADTQTRTRHNANRELVGQGIGNFVTGVIGGLPGAGATTGTLTNIQAGGRTRLSGALAATILIGLLAGLGWIAEPIPIAVLSGILIRVGWDIIDWRFVLRMLAIRREYVLIMLVTFLVTVLFDLIVAVALGLIMAGIVQSRHLGRGELDSVLSIPLINLMGTQSLDEIDPKNIPVCVVKMKGRFSIGSSNELARVVAADIEDHEIIILDFVETTDVDDSAALAIEEIVESAMEGDTSCIVSGLSGEVSDVLNSLNVFHKIPDEHFVKSFEESKRLARSLLHGDKDSHQVA